LDIRSSGSSWDLEGLEKKRAEALSKPPPSATRPPLLEVRKLAIRRWLCNPHVTDRVCYRQIIAS